MGQLGMTAYAGITAVLQPQPGENVVVSAAASSVGSMAGQIAKLAGARVVGIAGTAAKCAWVTDELGFDACIDYRTDDVAARLKELCPGGVNVFFDNVGGELLDTVLRRIAPGAPHLVVRLAVHRRRRGRLPAAQLPPAHEPAGVDGGLQHHRPLGPLPGGDRQDRRVDRAPVRCMTRTEVVDGLDAAPELLVRLFAGDHLGKLVAKVATLTAVPRGCTPRAT